MSLVLTALGPFMTVWSLSGTAWAEDEAAFLSAVQAKVDSVGAASLVVCASGEEGEKAAKRMLADPHPDLTIARFPVLGDVEAEVERIRVEQGATCAVWLRKGTDTPWDTGVVGPCTRPAAEPTIEPVIVGATGASLDADPDEGVAAGPPAAPTTTTPVRPTRVLPPKLTVAELARNPDDIDSIRWHVVDERGVSWSTHRFATAMGDSELVSNLDSELQRAGRERKILMWTGIAGMAASPLPLLATESGSYGSNADLAWTSLFLLASGGMTFALHKVGEQSDKRRQLRPALYYDRADADALVSAYNARIDAQQAILDAEPSVEEPDEHGEDSTSASPQPAVDDADVTESPTPGEAAAESPAGPPEAEVVDAPAVESAEAPIPQDAPEPPSAEAPAAEPAEKPASAEGAAEDSASAVKDSPTRPVDETPPPTEVGEGGPP